MKRFLEDWQKSQDFIGALYRAFSRSQNKRYLHKAALVQSQRKRARHGARLAMARHSQAWHFDGIAD